MPDPRPINKPKPNPPVNAARQVTTSSGYTAKLSPDRETLVNYFKTVALGDVSSVEIKIIKK